VYISNINGLPVKGNCFGEALFAMKCLILIAVCCQRHSYWTSVISAKNLPSLILCAIGAAGVIAAFRTLIVVRRQMDANEKQLTLASRQWVEIRRWTVAPSTQANVTVGWLIRFNIFNPTLLPLRVMNIETTIEGATPFTDTEHFFVIPRKSNRRSATFYFTDGLEKKSALSQTIHIKITVRFHNALGEPWEQHQGGALVDYAADKALFVSDGNMILREGWDSKDQPRN
jgi:hypothetical protein